ncbi:MAG: hypothetical protein EAX96_21180 [Candidatus Lokiarchaeota archaeon]|nr:hypothetical protein [Candidatus Lokiarchaeota archaeon]
MSEKNNDQNGEDDERLHLRLPKGMKKEWKKKAKKKGHSSLWKYIKYLVENDIEDNEVTPEAMKRLNDLSIDNQVMNANMNLLIEKIAILENLMRTKTIMKELISEKLTKEILDYLQFGPRRLSDVAAHLNQDEILTIGMLDTMEGLGKVRRNAAEGVWEIVE